jgi:hypothetical protein
VFVSGAGTAATPYVSTTKLAFNPSIGTIYATLLYGTALQAQYADLAEKYVADAQYEPGTVLVFGGSEEVTLATEAMSTSIAGIVSTDPAYLMNSNLEAEYVAIVALQGRVPAKVVGPVGKGDMLVSAPAGFVQACSSPVTGSVIGRSLEDFTATDEIPNTIIEIAVGRA